MTRWRTAHKRRRRAERALVRFQQAIVLYHLMAAYALIDAAVEAICRHLIGEALMPQQLTGVSAGGVFTGKSPLIGEMTSEYVISRKSGLATDRLRHHEPLIDTLVDDLAAGLLESKRDDDFDPASDDHDDDDYFDCGRMPDGSCSQAGSEHCDFDCRFRNW